MAGDFASNVGADTRAQDKGPGAPLPPTFVYVGGFGLAWSVHAASPLEFGVSADGRTALTAVGMLAVVLGTMVFLWALRIFSTARTGIMLQKPASSLMWVGPYKWSRNPQYVSFTVIYIGVALMLNSIWPVLLLPLVIGLVGIAVIAREERYLRTTFGARYEEYCRNVNRWL